MTHDALEVRHNRFGLLTLAPDAVIRFGGLPGFPGADRFALLRHDRESAFLWLVSLDDSDLAFAVADPRHFFPGYAPTLSAAQMRAVGAERVEDLELLAIATVRDGRTTLNLAAPLVVNPGRGRGSQVILEDSAHGTREALPRPAPVRSAPGAAQIESKPQR